MSSKLPNRSLAPLAALALKTVGLVILIAALVDMLVMPYPYQFLDREWQINTISQLVDRGIVPMVAVALFLTGSWIDQFEGLVAPKRKALQDLKFWVLLLSSLLGLFYLLAIPLHLNNVLTARGEALQKIDAEAAQADTRLDAQIGQQRQQIDQLIANPNLLEQAVEQGRIPQQEAALLEQFKQNPESLDQFIDQRVGEIQTRLGLEQEQLRSQVQSDATKSIIRIGISSLLLAIGYIIISWNGLKSWDEVASP